MGPPMWEIWIIFDPALCATGLGQDLPVKIEHGFCQGLQSLCEALDALLFFISVLHDRDLDPPPYTKTLRVKNDIFVHLLGNEGST